MTTNAFLYKWTHLPTQMWYIGSRSAQGCHPNDGYLCSSDIVKPLIIEDSTNWHREVLVLGDPNYIADLENKYLLILDAKNNPMSFNKHNGDGIYVTCGDKNPMKNPIIAKKVADAIRGKNHWTTKLGDRVHPQVGQKRPTITGDNHPNKKSENAAKISAALKGKKHDYALGDKNVMRDPNVAAKLSGDNHWMNKHARHKCPHCGLECSKSNFTRWHGNNCKRNNSDNQR